MKDMENDDICLGKLDYFIDNGIWDYGVHPPKLLHDYNRIKVNTERFSEFIKRETGKEVPVGSIVWLTERERIELQDKIDNAICFIGIIGAREPDGYDWYKHFYEKKMYPITNEYEEYDLKWSEL